MNKKKWIYIVDIGIVAIITFLTLYYLLKENPKEKLEALSNLGVLGIITLLSLYIINVLLEGVINRLVVNSGTNKITLADAAGVYCVGKLFSNITPMKVGNMPAVIYSYNKSGLRVDNSIACFLQCNFIYLLNMIIVCTGCVIACFSLDLSIMIGNTNVKLSTVAIVGLVYNFLMAILGILIAFSSHLQNLFLRISSWFLFKIKKIRNREEYYLKEQEHLKRYREAIINFLKNLKIGFEVLILFIVKTFIWGAVPYVIYLLISESSFIFADFMYSFMLSQLLYYVASIVPIPGASGAIELSFMAVYSNMISENFLVSVVILWRVVTYFIPIIVGFGFFIKTINKRKNNNILLDNTID